MVITNADAESTSVTNRATDKATEVHITSTESTTFWKLLPEQEFVNLLLEELVENRADEIIGGNEGFLFRERRREGCLGDLERERDGEEEKSVHVSTYADDDDAIGHLLASASSVSCSN